MDVALRRSIIVGLLLLASVSAPSAHAYDEYSHEWITRSAFYYLKSNPHVYPETKKWIENNENEPFLEELLVRSAVDTDYRSDIWLRAWFHDKMDGAETNGLVAMFTTMFHFLNVTTPGRYWGYDGYSYSASTQSGNDAYLNEPSVNVEGSESVPLGGSALQGHAVHGANLGPYDSGFMGDADDWQDMFFDAKASDAVFPPSYVPAELAYSRLMSSPRAAKTLTQSWTEIQNLVTGALSNRNLTRTYWRGEIAGLPRYMDLLGMVIHLEQDTTVPQHVEDTSDRCHPEYERAVDQLACGATAPLDYDKYYSGNYGGDADFCTALYDPSLVNEIIADQGLLDPGRPLSLTDRMVQSALLTSQWDWRVPSNENYATLLPDGSFYAADTCQGLLSEPAVQKQAKYQFNLAVAETVSIIELAAHQYESRHAARTSLPLTLSWFQSGR